MNIWSEPDDVIVPDGMLAAIGGHPLVSQTLVRRGFLDARLALAFLDPDRFHPTSAFELPGMEQAVLRLKRALRNQEHILVWGDFDVDGQTATAVLVSALLELGGNVSWHIPVRARESHGVNIPVLSELLARQPGILLTCDTGVSSHAALAFAVQQGVDVIVTDHHQLPERLPEALAVINPQMLAEEHPLASLPGVGVVYKLVEGLFGEVGTGMDCARFLDLAAMGTIADLASLRGESRYMVQRGMALMRKSPRLGIQVMLELADVQQGFLTEEHIGFELAPRMNALGRLGDANPVVELLMTTDRSRALSLAYDLERANNQRRLLTSQIMQAALALIDQDRSVLDESVLVLAHPTWPAGVLGIVASQLADRYHKPAILISTPDGQIGRASARSIEGIDITAAIRQNADLLENFGGHPMAAGFAVRSENIARFRVRLGRTVAQLGVPEETALEIDGYLPLEQVSLALAEDLERLAPFGTGNPALTLVCPRLRVQSQERVGRNQEHLLLTIEDDKQGVYKTIWWQGAGWSAPVGLFDLAYKMRASTFRGQRDVQVEWVDYRLVAPEPAGEITSTCQVNDLRGQNQPLVALKKLLGDPAQMGAGDLQIFAEGAARQRLVSAEIMARSRVDLKPGTHLVIWTAPPEPAVWRSVLKAVNPQTITLFVVPAEPEPVQKFLSQLAGMVKFSLREKEGRLDYQNLAAATAQSVLAVRLGIDCLAAQGFYQVYVDETGNKLLRSGGIKDEQVSIEQLSVLREILEETNAYRKFFLRAPAESLLRE
jgi:single-stranded-DNA-specific exonuclease